MERPGEGSVCAVLSIIRMSRSAESMLAAIKH